MADQCLADPCLAARLVQTRQAGWYILDYLAAFPVVVVGDKQGLAVPAVVDREADHTAVLVAVEHCYSLLDSYSQEVDSQCCQLAVGFVVDIAVVDLAVEDSQRGADLDIVPVVDTMMAEIQDAALLVASILEHPE